MYRGAPHHLLFLLYIITSYFFWWLLLLLDKNDRYHEEKFTCMKIQIKHFLYTKAAHQRCHKGKENIFWKQFFSKNTSGVLLLYIASVCSPWDSLLYFFCHFTTSSRSRIKNTKTQWHSDVTIPYSVTCNVFWSSQFWKQQAAVVFYIGGNGITSARIASFNVISIHKNFFFC